MTGADGAPSDERPARYGRLQLGLSVLIGAVAAFVSLPLGIPGNGSWIVVCWILGVGAAVLRPNWTSFVAAVVGIALAAVLLVLRAGQYPGLAWLVVTSEATILGHGFFVGATIRSAVRRRTLRDAHIVWRLAVAIGTAVSLVVIAQEFARNPP